VNTTASRPDSEPAAITRGRYAGFDGLRALAALAIVVLHVTSATGATGSTSYGRYFARLDVGVTIFFVISAFLLYRPFVDAHLHARTSIALRVFWWRRGLRIFPAYWVALTAAILLFGATHLSGFWDYARHFLLVQIYQPKFGLAGIVPAWTLAVEISFYAALPLYAWVLGRCTRDRPVGQRVTIELVGAALLYVFGLAWHLGVTTTRGTDTMSARWLPAMSDWFALGILLAVLCSAARIWPVAARLREYVDRYADAAFVLAIVTYIGACNIGLPVNFSSGTVREDFARQILFGLVGFFLVAPAALGLTHRGVGMRVLDSRPAIAIGTISYGIFLYHYLWIGQLQSWGAFEWFRSARTPFVLVATLALTLVTAVASWFLVEQPLLRLKDRFGSSTV
jgi:peptidoglycan/LPS O-acetylase OafA/YrhL